MIGQKIRGELDGKTLRASRASAGIAGDLLSARAGIGRGRLCRIERGYVDPTPEEAQRLTDALEKLVGAREKMAALAAEVGWPL
jgi:predicted transcriptional regulator